MDPSVKLAATVAAILSAVCLMAMFFIDPGGLEPEPAEDLLSPLAASEEGSNEMAAHGVATHRATTQGSATQLPTASIGSGRRNSAEARLSTNVLEGSLAAAPRVAAPPPLAEEYPRTPSPPAASAAAGPPTAHPVPAYPSGPVSAGRPSRHRIVDGDTLPRLAERYLGTSRRYLEIYEINRDVLRTPDELPIGVELRIPAAGMNPLR